MKRKYKQRDKSRAGMWRNKAKAKLTDKEVEILRRMLDQGVTQKEIVVIFELSKGYVSRIANYLVR